jgi:hypothetical protein
MIDVCDPDALHWQTNVLSVTLRRRAGVNLDPLILASSAALAVQTSSASRGRDIAPRLLTAKGSKIPKVGEDGWTSESSRWA